MKSKEPQFPFFVATSSRQLSADERETIIKLLEATETGFADRVAKLRVVGRCGCRQCPTVFFEPHDPEVQEQDLSTYAGKDKEGGIVAAVLMQRQGRLSQLEYYSVDGHEPWFPPAAHDLEPYA